MQQFWETKCPLFCSLMIVERWKLSSLQQNDAVLAQPWHIFQLLLLSFSWNSHPFSSSLENPRDKAARLTLHIGRNTRIYTSLSSAPWTLNEYWVHYSLIYHGDQGGVELLPPILPWHYQRGTCSVWMMERNLQLQRSPLPLLPAQPPLGLKWSETNISWQPNSFRAAALPKAS